MKTKSILFTLLLFASCLCLLAQGEAPVGLTIPADLQDKPFRDWQLNLTTLFVASQLIGRAYGGLRAGGGIKGIITGIWLGTNTPKS